MKKRMWVFIGVAVLVASTCVQADPIASITADGVGNLTSITLDRGTGNQTYTAAQLIGFDLTGVGLNSVRDFSVLSGEGDPGSGNRAALLDGDMNLHTGFVNMLVWQIEFNTPVTNAPGADFVIFDMMTNGDTFTIRKVNGVDIPDVDILKADFTTGLLPSTPQNLINVQRASDGGEFIGNVADLEAATYEGTYAYSTSDPVAGIAIDFSDLGIADGETVTSIEMHGKGALDPVFAAGLPVPEPTTIGLLAIGGGLSLIRRKK